MKVPCFASVLLAALSICLPRMGRADAQGAQDETGGSLQGWNSRAGNPQGTLLLLHYRWRHDSLTLVESSRISAAVKLSRITPEKRARGIGWAEEGPRSGFSFEVLGPDGKRLASRFLQDPGERRVEYQVKGEHVLRSQVERVDSSDIFLRIPEAEASTIRFYRHTPDGIPAGNTSVGSAAGNVAGNAAGKAAESVSGKSAGPVVQGPKPMEAKTLIGEFALP